MSFYQRLLETQKFAYTGETSCTIEAQSTPGLEQRQGQHHMKMSAQTAQTAQTLSHKS